jgi:hypothetical protein
MKNEKGGFGHPWSTSTLVSISQTLLPCFNVTKKKAKVQKKKKQVPFLTPFPCANNQPKMMQ